MVRSTTSAAAANTGPPMTTRGRRGCPALTVTETGQQGFSEYFGIDTSRLPEAA